MSDESDPHTLLPHAPTARVSDAVEEPLRGHASGVEVAGHSSGNAALRRLYCQQMLAYLASPQAAVMDDTISEGAGDRVRASADLRPQIRISIDEPFLLDGYEEDLEKIDSRAADAPKQALLERAVTDALNVLRHVYAMNEKNMRAARARSGPLDIGIALSMPTDMKPWLGVTSAIEPIAYNNRLQQLDVMIHMPHMRHLREWQSVWQHDSAYLIETVDHGLLDMVDAADKHARWDLPTGYGRA